MKKPWKKLLGVGLAAGMLCLSVLAAEATTGLYDITPLEDGFTVKPVSESGVTVQIDGQDKVVYTGTEKMTLSYEDPGEDCSYAVFVLEGDAVVPTGENIAYMDQNETGTFTIYPKTLHSGTYSIYMSGTDLDYEKVASFSCYQETVTKKFADVPQDAYYAEAVNWAANSGIAYGMSETEFYPEAPCTRAHAITFLWRAAGSPEPETNEMPFTDVRQEAYYYKAVLWASETGVTTGIEKMLFGPDIACERCQIVSFLYRLRGNEVGTANMPFTDVPENSYFYSAVRWAAERNIAYGMTATTFEPERTCTRAQIVTFLYRAR